MERATYLDERKWRYEFCFRESYIRGHDRISRGNSISFRDEDRDRRFGQSWRTGYFGVPIYGPCVSIAECA